MAEAGAARRAGETFRSPALAKINLYLHVVGRRQDGYHLLDSLIAFAGIGDDIHAEASDDFSLIVKGPRRDEVPGDDTNLVLGAARRLAQAAGIKAGACLTLIKHLPVAAGVGGGSADAAATLRVLARLWGLNDDRRLLDRIALQVGADVPVCLNGKAAFASGIGEHLDPAPQLPPAWLVLVNPGRPLSTPAVFAARRGPFSETASFQGPIRDVPALALLLKERRNDLTEAAIALEPEVGAVLAALGDSSGVLLARMSGSGATCFGLCATQGDAAAAAETIAALNPRWWVASAPLVGDIQGSL